MDTAPDPQSLKAEFYARIDRYNLYPLWEAIGELMSSVPQTRAVPHLWRFDEVRPHLLESAGLISAQEAERRTLMLENPGMRGARRITEALYAGLQLIMPGEVAAPHRHTPSAMRMVIESENGYTSVDGEECPMEPGDLILNPSWAWHGHGHHGPGPHISMTCLDMPLVRFLGPVFAEPWPGPSFPDGPPAGDSNARYGANMAPMDHAPVRPTSPIFRYPFSQTRAALETMSRAGPIDPCHGIKMEYVNPQTGGPVLPTLSAFMQLRASPASPIQHRSLGLPRGQRDEAGPISGTRPSIGARRTSCRPGNRTHEADEQSHLYILRPQQLLGLHRARRAGRRFRLPAGSALLDRAQIGLREPPDRAPGNWRLETSGASLVGMIAAASFIEFRQRWR